MPTRTIIVLIAMALLAACVPTRQEYDSFVTLTQGSARARNEAVNICVKSFDANARRSAGIVTNASDKDAPRVACNRLLAAMISGRATYDDFVDIKSHRYTPKLIKISQGR